MHEKIKEANSLTDVELYKSLTKDGTVIPEDKFTPADIIFHLKNYVKKTELTDSEIMAKFISEPLTISYS